MIEQPSPNGRRVLLVIGGIAIGLLVVVTFFVTRAHEAAIAQMEKNTKEAMHKQIAEARSGKDKTIWISNELGPLAMEEFFKAKDSLQNTDFKLDIVYSSNVDGFLQRIQGLRGVRAIGFYKSDVTDQGLASIVTLPDLQELSILGGGITDQGLRELQANHELETLGILQPYRSNLITISTILALPHLRKLTLQDQEGGGWLTSSLDQLKQAHSLVELTLASDGISPEALQDLRSNLPNCDVKLESQHAYGP